MHAHNHLVVTTGSCSVEYGLFRCALIDEVAVCYCRYLHQILPAVLTCVVGKSLSNSPTENHWALRKSAAVVVRTVCDKFGHHGHIQSRITATMIGALLDSKKSLPTHYGAIVALETLGPNVIDAVLMDSVATYGLVPF